MNQSIYANLAGPRTSGQAVTYIRNISHNRNGYILANHYEVAVEAQIQKHGETKSNFTTKPKHNIPHTVVEPPNKSKNQFGDGTNGLELMRITKHPNGIDEAGFKPNVWALNPTRTFCLSHAQDWNNKQEAVVIAVLPSIRIAISAAYRAKHKTSVR